MDYKKFFNENCRLCGSQRCSGSDEEINECGKNPESDYAKTKAKLGFTNMGAIDGETEDTIVVNPTSNRSSNRSDSNCKYCVHKEICKHVSYYAGLVETVNQISVDSNFELRLWCKNYKSNTGVKG